ncbi:hypothetical protein BX666DRAFT_1897004 [Dichotomocladium elegans]|nr:hypothetical protein BX666DRAFT_1897004 [Dichotomocladium elegans]
MKFLSRKLGELGMIERRAIPKALVPICKFKDPRSGISCDINTANDMGVENSKLIQAYTKIDDRVRPFLYAIKHFSKQRRINDAFLGYLSSYSYVMMGLFYLMTCDPPVLPNLQALGKNRRI